MFILQDTVKYSIHTQQGHTKVMESKATVVTVSILRENKIQQTIIKLQCVPFSKPSTSEPRMLLLTVVPTFRKQNE